MGAISRLSSCFYQLSNAFVIIPGVYWGRLCLRYGRRETSALSSPELAD